MVPQRTVGPPAFPTRAVEGVITCAFASDYYILGTHRSCSSVIENFETDYARLNQLYMLNGLTVQH
tara:strand:- start:700 stop:897 length:198 start_codon:yes stop_codon:yes gene_type:complete